MWSRSEIKGKKQISGSSLDNWFKRPTLYSVAIMQGQLSSSVDKSVYYQHAFNNLSP